MFSNIKPEGQNEELDVDMTGDPEEIEEDEKEEELKRNDQVEEFKSTWSENKFEGVIKHAHYFLVYCYLLEGRLDDAIETAKKMKKGFLISQGMKFNLALMTAEALIKMSNYQEALKTLMEAMNQHGQGIVGKFESASTGLEEKAQLSGQAVVFLNMATLHFLTDNFEEAKDCLDNCASLAPSDSPSLALSLVYWNLLKGDSQQALKIIKKGKTDFAESLDLRICY